MSNPNAYTPGGDPPTIYCPQCGQSMRIAPQHLQMSVACPHCKAAIDPWRMVQVAHTGPPAPPSPIMPANIAAPQDFSGYSSRSKIVAGILGILLGSLGIHRFYLGYIGVGVVQILLTICTGGVAGIWGFVEGILCLTGHMRDIDGLPLHD